MECKGLWCLALALAALLVTVEAELLPGSSTVSEPDASIMMRLKRMYISNPLAQKFLVTWNLTQPCSQWLNCKCIKDRDGSIRFERLDFGSTKVGGPFPEFITGLVRLRLLYADNTQWTGSLPDSFSKLTRMNLIRMGANKMTGPLPASWSTMTQMVRFGMGNNPIGGTIPDTWKAMPMEEFYLDSALLQGPLPTVFCNWVNLRVLRIGGNRWTGSIPPCIGQLTKLMKLYFDGSLTITGPIPSTIGKLVSLQSLFLNQNQITGPIPSTVSGMSQLRDMFLSSTNVSGPLPSTIGKLTALTQLTMEFAKVNGSLPQTIGNMVSLSRILFTANQLTGTIPITLSKLKQLTLLYLQGNQLVGPLPRALPAGLVSMKRFNVGNNLLSGVPPGGWVSRQIEAINLRSNVFSGTPSYTYSDRKRFCLPLQNLGLSSIKFNCFQNKTTGCPEQDKELGFGNQFDLKTCQSFCGANNPTGACKGNGYCTYAKKCVCFKGFKLLKGTCVKARAPRPRPKPKASPRKAQASAVQNVALNAVGLDEIGFLASSSLRSETESGGGGALPAAPPPPKDPAALEQPVIQSLDPTPPPMENLTDLWQGNSSASFVNAGSGGGNSSLVQCHLGQDGSSNSTCAAPMNCKDFEGHPGCACVAGKSDHPWCAYIQQCLDASACLLEPTCHPGHHMQVCTCEVGYRPVRGTATLGSFSVCAKTKCSSEEPFMGFSCAGPG